MIQIKWEIPQRKCGETRCTIIPLCASSAEVWPDEAVLVRLAVEYSWFYFLGAVVANEQSSGGFRKGRDALRENDIAWRIPWWESSLVL